MADPGIFFFVSGHTPKIDPDSKLWSLPLQGEGTVFPDTPRPDSAETILIGDFLAAVRIFLEKDNFSGLRIGISNLSGLKTGDILISRIAIILEKHGAFYHPLKIIVTLSNKVVFRLVVNGAVAEPGRQLIETEFNLLYRLNHNQAPASIPRVFKLDMIPTPKGSMYFFLGEWFEAYLEFHITQTPFGKKTGLWCENGDIQTIEDPDAVFIYQSAAKILTGYYSLSTGEQIFPWHHAAGDFVVKPAETGFDVKLITVRGYDSLLEIPDGSLGKTEMMLARLLHFFLNLILRMRLDKIDGTKETVWLSDRFICGAIDGFLEGLDEKSISADIPDLKHLFLSFAAGMDEDQLYRISLNLVESYNPSSPEISLISSHLKKHCRIISKYLKNKTIELP